MTCLIWLMESGSTQGRLSKNLSIVEGEECDANSEIGTNTPEACIVKVDASDSIITNRGFSYFRECKRLEELKMNFCDFFGDDGIRELALGRPALTLKNIEIVCNPMLTDSAAQWLVKLRALQRAHFYFLPYVVNRTAMLRVLRLNLPKCKVTFPELGKIGYGYEE
ncbi:unnamed protein product [Dracunculus medinensis]|uniref:Uncharacterized protein n=1 Tax=Dracunculus medinensis TaxID=318479 RepID=A0A3P7Q330_DRAME|nr:unnamed protein product [Dracunculus medinensis]